jgi:uncharacterized protein involved in exopolysaccharide biosynthesis
MGAQNEPFTGSLTRGVVTSLVSLVLVGLGTFYFTTSQDAANAAGSAARDNAARIVDDRTRISALELQYRAIETVVAENRNRIARLEGQVADVNTAISAGGRYTAEYAERDFQRVENHLQEIRRQIDDQRERVKHLERSK